FIVFHIVCEIFPHDNCLALATMGAMATVPQHIAISASISNDVAAELLLALILWLVVRRVKNEITDRRFWIFGGILFGAALLTKTTAYVPSAVLLIGAEFARLRLNNLGWTLPAFRFLLFVFLLSLAIFSPWFIHGALTYGIGDPLGIARHDAVVVGQ